MEIDSRELAIYSIRQNMLGAEVEGKTCRVMLSTGKTLKIICPTEENAETIKEHLLYNYQYSNPIYFTLKTDF